MASQKAAKHRLLWIDLEMTGANVDEGHVLLEVGAAVTDWNMNILGTFYSLVRRTVHDGHLLSAFARSKFVRPGGTLWDECLRFGVHESQVDANLTAFIDSHRDEPTQLLRLCGMSVHNDRAFIKVFLPNTHRRLHHQHVDCTTILSLVQNWAPHLFMHAHFPRPRGVHRAMVDILESIALMVFIKPYVSMMGLGCGGTGNGLGTPIPTKGRVQAQIQAPSQTPVAVSAPSSSRPFPRCCFQDLDVRAVTWAAAVSTVLISRSLFKFS